MIPEQRFEDLSAVAMVRDLASEVDRLVDGSPEQVLFIFSHLQTIGEKSLGDLMELSTDQLVASWCALHGY